MTRTYRNDDNTQLSEHFNVQEFRCKCGQNHDIQISDELVSKLETLFMALDCSSIVINSGYRCAAHDRAVGGTGTGQHVNGNAADVVCYAQNGQPISSKLVCCKAQDIGFGGIANITSAYTSTHLDVRSGSKWYGNEVVSNHTVTDDFYKYYAITPTAEVGQKQEGECMRGIDVSRHNGAINWQRVKAAGIHFALLRAGFGNLASQKDTTFEENYAEAKAVGIPVGAYWYSYATTVEEARQEAEICVSVLQGKQFEFPIYFDQEDQRILNTGKANCSAMVRAFCDVLEAAGYWAGLYTSRSFLDSYIEDDIKTRYALWVAEWGSKLSYSGAVGIWQYTDSGTVDGITVSTDLDECYVDYPTMVKAAGLNGYNTAEEVLPIPPAPFLVDTSIEVEVTVDGKHYSGTLNNA